MPCTVLRLVDAGLCGAGGCELQSFRFLAFHGRGDLGIEHGTGTGTFTTQPHGCGPMSIAVGGEPHIGGTVSRCSAGLRPRR